MSCSKGEVRRPEERNGPTFAWIGHGPPHTHTLPLSVFAGVCNKGQYQEQLIRLMGKSNYRETTANKRRMSKSILDKLSLYNTINLVIYIYIGIYIYILYKHICVASASTHKYITVTYVTATLPTLGHFLQYGMMLSHLCNQANSVFTRGA